jgi:hypothetical protein
MMGGGRHECLFVHSSIRADSAGNTLGRWLWGCPAYGRICPSHHHADSTRGTCQPTAAYRDSDKDVYSPRGNSHAAHGYTSSTHGDAYSYHDLCTGTALCR